MECLYQAHARDVQRFVAYLDPPSLVDDLCQETWAAALRALPAYRNEASPRAWLFSIAKHKVLDAQRRRPRAGRMEEWNSREEFLSGMLTPGRRPTTPTSRLARNERADALESVLAALKAEDRELLELRFICGMKPQDIVSVLGLPRSANVVSQRLLRLTRRMRGQLLKHAVFQS
jgi:RNA polymerase sigma-70 factor (ECF subfamily)